MDEEQRQRIAMFRFGVLSSLLGRRGLSWGEREELIRQVVSKNWEIPRTPRSSIARTTLLRWLSIYERSGCQIEALKPRPRCDRGTSRSLDSETEAALVNLKRELPGASLPALLKVARQRKILGAGFSVSLPSLYRLFKRHGLDEDQRLPQDRRRFETELANDLWQCDCMHGPRVLHEGKMRKSYLFAIIDDHSRLIPHAQFYLVENLDSFRDCLLTALEKRGLPRKLYVDNGAVFRSHKLRYACARLGVALLHTTPYSPEGKGKIERFFRTVRERFLPELGQALSVEQINARLASWIDTDYHARLHSSTGQTPLERYLAHVALLRSAPRDLRDYFRTAVRRKVDKDRTVSLNGRVYEAPLGMIGKMVTLLFHDKDPGRIEVIFDEVSQGFLLPLDAAVNSRIRRGGRQQSELLPAPPTVAQPSYHGGSLFGTGDKP